MNYYKNWHNFVWFQSIWFLAILAGGQFEWLLALLIVGHLYLCKDWITELRVMLSCAAIGVSIDGTLTWFGVFVFTPSPELTLIPLWLVAIWFGFVGTLRHSLRFMTTKPLLMTIASGISAPLSYLAAMRFDAVEFPLGIWPTAIIVSVAWMLMMPIFLFVLRVLVDDNPSARTPQIDAKRTFAANK